MIVDAKIAQAAQHSIRECRGSFAAPGKCQRHQNARRRISFGQLSTPIPAGRDRQSLGRRCQRPERLIHVCARRRTRCHCQADRRGNQHPSRCAADAGQERHAHASHRHGLSKSNLPDFRPRRRAPFRPASERIECGCVAPGGREPLPNDREERHRPNRCRQDRAPDGAENKLILGILGVASGAKTGPASEAMRRLFPSLPPGSIAILCRAPRE